MWYDLMLLDYLLRMILIHSCLMPSDRFPLMYLFTVFSLCSIFPKKPCLPSLLTLERVDPVPVYCVDRLSPWTAQKFLSGLNTGTYSLCSQKASPSAFEMVPNMFSVWNPNFSSYISRTVNAIFP